jgi:hypothetical protein
VTVVLFEILGENTPEPQAAPREEAPSAGRPEATVPEAPQDRTVQAEGELRRHGAGPGGRVAALLLVAAVLVAAGLLLYWSVTR